ncbi:hypothetical protein AB0436_05090 [Streptomyces sp. NPDC051322]|uniref:hypothetical protein n=1 Tax=Streptomyces sp. NPDC051322 TaxID=3154645 RepID=UPI00344B3637
MTDELEPTVYDRHLTELLGRGDRENFQALMAQARHITTRSYETNLYDHQQAFRLLWSHLQRTGHMERAWTEARDRLAAGGAGEAERKDLELFLTVYDGVRPVRSPLRSWKDG